MKQMQYSIKDLENLSNIKAHTIRIWEKRYGIIQPERTQTNIRYYSDEQLRKLLNISILINNGVKISHIAAFNSEEIKEKALYLLQNPNDAEIQIKNLIISMVELNEAKFEKILAKSILSNGFEKTMLNLIYPFLQQIGVLWQTGAINPAQEHFMSNLIRQKLISSIDAIEFTESLHSKRFMLFLPDGEWHELGLLFYNYLLKVRGHHTLYLGQSTPVSSLPEAVHRWKPDYLVLFLTSGFSGISTHEFVFNMSTAYPDLKIIIAGEQVREFDQKWPSNFIHIKIASDFIQFIEKL